MVIWITGWKSLQPNKIINTVVLKRFTGWQDFLATMFGYDYNTGKCTDLPKRSFA